MRILANDYSKLMFGDQYGQSMFGNGQTEVDPKRLDLLVQMIKQWEADHQWDETISEGKNMSIGNRRRKAQAVNKDKEEIKRLNAKIKRAEKAKLKLRGEKKTLQKRVEELEKAVKKWEEHYDRFDILDL